MPTRNSFAAVISAAKQQAQVTGLSPVGDEIPEATVPELEPVPGAREPVVPKPARKHSAPRKEPVAAATDDRVREDPDAGSWVADLTATRQGDWLTVYGVPVPLPKGSEDESVTMSFRCPRWLREAVHMRCRQYGVEVQEFGQAALAVVLAQLQATDLDRQ